MIQSADPRLQGVWKLIEGRRYRDAEEICRRLLFEQPNLLETEFALGVICFRNGEKTSALDHLERFLSHSPNEVAALGLAAQLLLESGQYDRALELGQRAYKLRPDEGPMLLLHITGQSELAKNRPLAALKAFRDLVRLNPSQPAGYLGAADGYVALGSSFDALALYARVAEMSPSKAALMKQGGLELKLGRPTKAMAVAEKILAREPSDVHATVLAGQSLIEQDRVDEAERFWELAGTASPNSDWIELKHGASLAMMGRFEEAERHLQKSVALEPRQGNAYQLIFANRMARAEDMPMVSHMEAVFKTGNLVPNERAALAFAIGKASDDLDDPEKAFRFYDAAHEIQREMLEIPFDLDHMKEQFEAQRTLFSSPATPASEASYPPIFVIGMMRSGTTLTEQILSAHSQVVGAGEIDFWTGSEALLVNRSEPRFFPEVAHERASTYRRILNSFGGDQLRVVDKHPGNLNVIGMIHHILPEAPIVYLRRNPIDIAISLWGTYSNPYSPFTVSRRTIVSAIRQSMVQADYWRQTLPEDRFLEVHYEDLVSEPEAWTRRILEFCRLPWEDACLSPGRSSQKVRTPSLWQVRQPVYKTSIERWRRYEPWLGEFRNLL